ncbi:MAG: RNA polymerase sigma factor [Acidobacteriota bacterium]
MNGTDFAAAFETGYASTRRFLLSRGAGADEADEIAQAAWVRGWEYRQQLRDPSLIGYWVNSIARNLFRARFRTATMTSLEGVEPSYQMRFEHNIDLKRMLDKCGRRDRALLQKSLDGYSAEELAVSEGISATGVRVRLLRVRQNLRQEFALAA